jgi:hypothetical protein
MLAIYGRGSTTASDRKTRRTRERDAVVGNSLKQMRPLRLAGGEVKVKVWDDGEAWHEAERSPFA